MNKILRSLLVAFAALAVTTAQAQLPDGSVAPDFTFTDINGVEHTLYDYLDEGYTVILDLFAVWCGPCWEYHNTGTSHPNAGALKDIYEQYGPDGTQEVMVIALEVDASTPANTLFGGGNSIGDWTVGVDYPMGNTDEVANLYALAYYPTLYTICPNRILSESGQGSVAQHYGISQDCESASEGTDASMLSYNGDVEVCGDGEAEIIVTIQNMGTEPLTAATIEVSGDASLTYDWTGNLGTYQTETVVAGSLAISNDANLTVEVNATNDANSSNNAIALTIGTATEATSLFKVDLLTDNWGEEVSWDIRDENGTVMESVPAGSLGNNTLYTTWVSLPATGCYTFTIYDEFGDGLNAAQWGGTPGSCTVKSYNDDIVFISTIYEYNGNYDYDQDGGSAEVTAVNVSVEENDFSTSTQVYPNPITAQTNLVFSLGQAERTFITVYNIVGERVMDLDLGVLPAGEQREVLDFSALQAGVYMITLTAGENQSVTRVTLTK